MFGLAAFFAALAGVFLAVGGSATFQAAQLAFASGEAHAFGRHGTGGCETVGFGTDDLRHEITPVNFKNPAIISALGLYGPSPRSGIAGELPACSFSPMEFSRMCKIELVAFLGQVPPNTFENPL